MNPNRNPSQADAILRTLKAWKGWCSMLQAQGGNAVKLQTYSVLVGDCIDSMRGIPSESIQCCVTSPPYWGLRDYGVEGQIGNEPTLDEFMARLVNVFREVRRVLKPDGIAWVNMGDSYAQNGGAHGGREDNQKGVGGKRTHQNGAGDKAARRVPSGFKPKEILGQPWRLAFALQSDGWWLRQDIVWHKPNPMPESVRDRCTKAHEYLFMLTKSDSYYWDAEAMKERATNRPPGNKQATKAGREYADAAGEHHRTASNLHEIGARETRNRRSVWSIPFEPSSEAHFAVFPTEIPRRCILASSRPGDTVLDPFGGSGTTGIVAIELGRSAILCELNPKYASIASRRLQNTEPGLHLA